MAISGTKGHGWRAIPTQYRKGQRYINLNPGRLFIQLPPKKGKGSRGSFKLGINRTGFLWDRCFSWHQATGVKALNTTSIDSKISLNNEIQVSFGISNTPHNVFYLEIVTHRISKESHGVHKTIHIELHLSMTNNGLTDIWSQLNTKKLDYKLNLTISLTTRSWGMHNCRLLYQKPCSL